jgi:2-polyprenyl-3-methyl-5-hydroxy-6-metoxy-1,4-benzoquinol methylase
MVDRRTCDLCSGTEFTPIAQRDRRGRPLATVVCNTCGLVSHALIPTDQELAAYYAFEYRRDYHGEYMPSAYRVVREWKRGRGLLQLMRDDLRPGDKVIEIGSGIGCTVMNFALAGFDACGVEPGEGFCRFSREKLHANVKLGTLEDLPSDEHYDFVLLVHVLEHLPRPTEALKRIHDLLRPGGRLYVEVPNFAAPHAAPGKQFHQAHIYNFTPSTLRMLGAKAGLRVERAYTAPFDKNISLLFSRSVPAEFQIEGMSYTHTMAALRRYSTLSYHLRPMYLLERVATFARLYSDRCFAQRRLEKILSQCDEHVAQKASQQPVKPVRRAA